MALDIPASPGASATSYDTRQAERRLASSAQLIRLEGELRLCPSREDLWLHLANEPVVLLPFGQALVLEPHAPLLDARVQSPVRWKVVALSGVARVNPDAPLLRWYQNIADRLWAQHAEQPGMLAFEAADYADGDDPCSAEASFKYLLWVPLADLDQPVRGAWLLAREQPWDEAQQKLAARLALAYAHGLSAIAGRARPRFAWRRYRPLALLTLLATVLVLALVRVPLTTLAPMEVTPQDPFVVTASIPSVVARVLVPPGAHVTRDTPLVQLVDTQLRSDLEVASQALEVARAQVLRLQQAAVADPSVKRELAMAQTEEKLAQAKQDYARAMLGMTLLRAPQDGVALYGDARDWIGRPVAVGEAIMRIADPQRVEFQLQVPVADAVNLHEGSPVRIFLDAAPLDPVPALIVRAAYRAQVDAAGVASYTAIAHGSDPKALPERLGLRGTARIYGEPVTLFYYLLRRPITALRQWIGV